MVTTERRTSGARWTCTLFTLFTVALAALLVPTGLVATASANAAAPTFSTPCFTSAKIGQTGSYTVPATGVSTVRAILYGQNGAGGNTTPPGQLGHTPPGGLGATLVVEVPVTPGQVLLVGRLTGAPGGTGAGTIVLDGGTYTGLAGGNGGDAQYLSTAGSDGCQHALAVAGGGGGSGVADLVGHAVGGNADAGTGATAGGDGGYNYAVDGAAGGGATAMGGGSGGAAGHDPGYCHNGNAGSSGGFLTGGDGGNAAGTMDVNPCYYPGGGGGGGGGGYRYGGGGGSPYANHSPGGGGGGSSYIDASATKLSLSAGAPAGDPVVVPVYDTAITIASSPNPSTDGNSVTITARVTVVGLGRPVPGGTVNIYVEGAFTAVPVGTNGEATLTTTALPTGSSRLQAQFLDTTNPAEADRTSWTQGFITQVVNPCAPAPTFIDQPANVTATVGTSVQFSATVSVAPVYGGTPQVQWQTSTDSGTTWTNAPGVVFVVPLSTATGRVTMSFNASVPVGDLKYRAVATTCGGTTASNTATLTVKGIVFNLSTLPAKAYGDAFDISSYAAASNVPVSFSSATSSVCTVSGNTVTILAAGTCTINADQAGTSSYPAAPQVQQSFTVNKKAITVVAGTPPSQPQGTASAPTVTCTSNGFVGSDTFVTPPTGAVYVGLIQSDGSTLYRRISVGASRPAGNYVTRCSGGDPGSNYTIRGYTDGTFTIGPPLPPPLTISANSKSYTYGATPPTLDVAYSGSSNALVGTLSCSAYAKSDTGYASPIVLSGTTPVVAGGYAIHCSGLSSSSYTITWADGTLTVNPAPVTVTASSPTPQTYGATAAPSVTCSATGFVGADSFVTNPAGAVYASSGTDQVSIGSTASAGDYVTTCTGGDPGSNYTISGYTPGTFTINRATLTVTPDAGQSMVYGSTTVPTISFQLAGFKNSDLSSMLTQQPGCATSATAYNGTTAGSGSPVGTYSITCSGGVAANYIFSENPTAVGFTVTPAALTITADNQSVTYGGMPPALTWKANGLVNGDIAGSAFASPNTAPLCSTVAATSHAGGYAITCSGAANPNYTIGYTGGTLTINPAALTITATNKPMTYGGTLPALTWTANFVNGDTATALTTLPTCSTVPASSIVGTYAITCSGAADPDYTLSYTTGTLTINQASTGTALTSSVSPAASAGAVTFRATVTGPGSIPGGVVTFKDGSTTLGTGTLSTSGVATFTTTTLAIGQHSITASYGGDYNFLGSGSSTVTQQIDTNLSSYPHVASGAYNLANATLSNAYLWGWTLSGANLRNGTFTTANFTNATLSGANLSGGSFTGATFTGAVLTNAVLNQATLKTANFTNATFSGATGGTTAALTGAIWNNTTCPDGTNSTTDGGTCMGHGF